jgi:hypothetical protein
MRTFAPVLTQALTSERSRSSRVVGGLAAPDQPSRSAHVLMRKVLAHLREQQAAASAGWTLVIDDEQVAP